MWSANIVGPTGRQMLWSTGSGAIETHVAAIIEAWGPPETVAGSYELTIDCLEIAGDRRYVEVWCTEPLADPWRFAFDLPKPSGAIVAEVSRETVGDATVSLIELRVSETMLTAKLAPDRRRSRRDVVVAGRIRAGVHPRWRCDHRELGRPPDDDPKDRGPDGDLIEASSETGLGATTGRWTVEIRELWYVVGDAPPESAVRLTGPWIFEVEVPMTARRPGNAAQLERSPVITGL